MATWTGPGQGTEDHLPSLVRPDVGLPVGASPHLGPSGQMRQRPRSLVARAHWFRPKGMSRTGTRPQVNPLRVRTFGLSCVGPRGRLGIRHTYGGPRPVKGLVGARVVHPRDISLSVVASF